MKNSIIVLVEHFKGAIAEITYEMLGAGRKLADDLNVPLIAAVLGKGPNGFISHLGAADLITIVEDEKLEMASPSVIADALKSIYEQKESSIILIGGTNITSGVGPVLASRLKLPFLNFCKDIRTAEGEIIIKSQLFGGKILSDTVVAGSKGVVAIYPGSFSPENGKINRGCEIEEIKIPPIQQKSCFKKYIEPEAGDVDVTKETILVSVGRGIENSDNIGIAEDLIGVIGGAIAASRPVIDQGWLPLSRQIGKSGMIVKPKLYFALGISGAPEHVEGMKDSELIIAINKDASAPIFNVAHYGICADLQDIVPLLTDKLKAAKA